MTDKTILLWVDERYRSDEAVAEVEGLVDGRKTLWTTDRDEALRHRDSIDIALGDVPRDMLLDLPCLEWFQQFGTGVEWMQSHPGTAEAPFLLTNCSDGHCEVVADHLFALILSVARCIPRFVRRQDERRWDRPDDLGEKGIFELRGKTLLVVGLGSIGREIVRRAEAFSLRCIGARKDASKPFEGVEKIYGIDSINTAAGEADLVAACLPDTADSRNVFGASFFESMKQTGYFFNVGRGTTVDEAALDEALRRGSIAGAGLDVFDKEPLDSSSPLWDAPNLLITPHIGGHYDRVIENWLKIGIDNLRRRAEGKPLRNVVDKRAGY